MQELNIVEFPDNRAKGLVKFKVIQNESPFYKLFLIYV